MQRSRRKGVMPEWRKTAISTFICKPPRRRRKILMTGQATTVECLAGWQVEISLPRNWTLYSTVYKTEEQATKAARRLAGEMGIDLVWEEGKAAEAKEEK